MPLLDTLKNTRMLLNTLNKSQQKIEGFIHPIKPSHEFSPWFLKHPMSFFASFYLDFSDARTDMPAALARQCCWWCCGRSLVVAFMGQPNSGGRGWWNCYFVLVALYLKTGDFPRSQIDSCWSQNHDDNTWRMYIYIYTGHWHRTRDMTNI